MKLWYNPHSAFRILVAASEIQLCGKLHQPRVADSPCDLPKARTENVCHRIGEVHFVEGVEDLPAKLQILALAKSCTFGNVEVDVESARTIKHGLREFPELAGCRQAEESRHGIRILARRAGEAGHAGVEPENAPRDVPPSSQSA